MDVINTEYNVRKSCIRLLKQFKKLIIDSNTHYKFSLSELKELHRINLLYSASYIWRYCNVSRQKDGMLKFETMNYAPGLRYKLRPSTRRFKRLVDGEL